MSNGSRIFSCIFHIRNDTVVAITPVVLLVVSYRNSLGFHEWPAAFCLAESQDDEGGNDENPIDVV